MKRYLAVILVLVLSCGLVGYGELLPMEASGHEEEIIILVEEPSKAALSAEKESSETPAVQTAAVSAAKPTASPASFTSMGAGTSCRQIVEPVVDYTDTKVSAQLQAAEEERLAKEAELAARDESQRVYSTAMVGSVIAVEDMISADAAPLDLSTVVFATQDASGVKSILFNEDGVLKVWREQTELEKTAKESKETSKPAEESSSETVEESYVEESTAESGEEESTAESGEEESYEEESYEEESYEEESTAESGEEESSEEESSEEESSEEESSDESEEDSSENSEEDSEDSEAEESYTYELPTDGEYYYGYAQEVFEKTNALRASLGIAPLSWSGELEAFAMTRAQEITISFSHYRPGGGHYSNYGPEHENIAWGYGSPDAVFEGWYTSYDHYNNLTDVTMSSVGIACYRYEGILYWVMSFW